MAAITFYSCPWELKTVKIFLDLDDVLVDFTGEACKLHGVDYEELKTRWAPGSWGIDAGLGLTADQFWAVITEAGEPFWKNLPWLPHAEFLMELVGPHPWWILTTPARHPSSWSGKKRWADKTGQTDRLILTRDKTVCANRNSLLIDDRYENCQEFYAAGGNAICYPAHNNPNHKHQHDPLTYVEAKLQYIFAMQSATRRFLY